jgi:sirohydrochlorin ferrochelatase
MSFPPSDARPAILLVDNGSLEPAATLSLRTIAAQLGRALGDTVEPISLLHSSALSPHQLEDRPAEILAPAIEERLKNGRRRFLIVPLFFGPSAALIDYLPRRIGALKEKFPQLEARLAPPLVNVADTQDDRLAAILADRVRTAPAAHRDDDKPAVILVDHGSPSRAVVAVRDHLTAQLRARLGNDVRAVLGASMERRPGAEFAFAEPLLEKTLDQPGFNAGVVVLAMLFLSPGRHAGPQGDVAQIAAAARRRHPQLRPVMTDLVGAHPDLIPILVDRVRAGLASAPL